MSKIQKTTHQILGNHPTTRARALRRRMAELCSRRCRTISRDASAADAARAMAPENGAKVSFLPVTQDEHSKTLVGIVTLNALVKAGL